MIIQASLGHEFVNQEMFVVFQAIPQQLNQIRVRKSTQKVHLCLPFIKTLNALAVQFFDGDDDTGVILRWCQIPLVDTCFVDFPESTLSEEIVRSEGLGGGFQLRQAENSEVGRLKDLSSWGFFHAAS